MKSLWHKTHLRDGIHKNMTGVGLHIKQIGNHVIRPTAHFWECKLISCHK